jgi:hypothetical protein
MHGLTRFDPVRVVQALDGLVDVIRTVGRVVGRWQDE